MRWVTSLVPNPLPVFGPSGTTAMLQATEAMLEPDIGYRLAHHDDLQWRPTATVTEVDGAIFEEGRAGSPLSPPITRRSGPPSASASTTESGRW